MLKFRTAVLALALVAAIIVVVWPGLAGLGSRFGFWDFGFGLGTMTREWWPVIWYVSGGLGLLALILSLVLNPRKLAGLAVAVIAIGAPIAAKMQYDNVRATAQAVPAIHDITTDMQDPPMFTDAIMAIRNASGSNPADYVGKLKPGRDGEPDRLVSDLQAEAYPDIVPIRIDVTPAEAHERTVQAVQSLGWALVSDDPGTGIVEATDTTFWYGFKDDVIIRIRSNGATGSVVDIRSLSRVGGSDLGKNASRIREFRSLIID
ncbi:Uncharacterized conserved protein, DUF1499 family [Parasphingorhabdus marina DSM 22363]|uniref:Uncharacterized conserved protein, DUF1499 family n=1 Tax=Parasphingorhabdus marina DSM 22363 TaxID=1123272 RepID=A0A1N6HKL2_9SPHN|nr:DUF1499 domain-containing protein [Parasphingorhabdus marina]SIO20293.1 Uncharacterized conserved protein, DUF1499 family [Parasphingorhabdus marina DSM 22363]